MSALACHTSTGPVILVCGEISGPKILAILNYMLDSLAMRVLQRQCDEVV